MNRLIDFKSRFRILKGGKISLVVSALLGSAVIASAAPSGGTVTSGTASISQTGAVTNIEQSTQKATINWNDFSIKANETVNFNQPNSSSITLNRVIGNEKSIISGALNANGQVWILNSNGVLFNSSASINTSGILATTAELSDTDFNAGNYNFKNSSSNSVINLGTIEVANSGYVVLASNEVKNSGTIKAVKGKVHLVGADEYTLNLNGNSIVNLIVNKGVLDSMVENSGTIIADGGEVYLTTNAVNELLKGVVNNTGIIEANSLDGLMGKVEVSSNIVVNNGSMKASGEVGGKVSVKASLIIDAGTTNVDGIKSAGTITQNSIEILQSKTAKLSANSSTGNAGKINLISDTTNESSSVYLSGEITATGVNGGEFNTTASKVTLNGAKVDTSGTNNAGSVKIGGDWQGSRETIANASITNVLNSTITNNGTDGQIVVWSDDETNFSSTILAKNSKAEISSKNSLGFDSKNVQVKSLLLDPKNIEIKDISATLDYLTISNPNNTADDYFGQNVVELSNGNYVITAAGTDVGGALDVGRVYLYSPTGGLISTLSGTKVNDYVGNSGVTALTNGNYVVRSGDWDNGTIKNAGAVTWGDGTSGISGVISTSNSLVGTKADDNVGNNGVTALSNGNYVVISSYWDKETGAVTWVDATDQSSRIGVVSTSNSLVGTKASDNVGSNGVTALSNGNYIVISSYWDNEAITDAGAVTWVDATNQSSRIGVISASNSLVGTKTSDNVGSSGVTALSNGNYVVSSNNWNTRAGAVTWVDATDQESRIGVVSASNSLVGTKAYDYVGNSGVTALTNGNYVVSSGSWDNESIENVGAVTWIDATDQESRIGVVSASNSLIGTTAYDNVGSFGVTALSNGNYVVISSYWDNEAITDVGAVTWVDATDQSSRIGVVSTSNSLVGTKTYDNVGSSGVTALSNGNYVIASGSWDNGIISNAGAVTWVDATDQSSRIGVVSTSNSLVGTKADDQVGSSGVTALTNGNYVVSSSSWDNGIIEYAGAVTWGDGTKGTSGVISSSNSLLGTTAYEQLGQYIYTNGDKVIVKSPYASNGGEVYILKGMISGTSDDVSSATFSNNIGSDSFISPDSITALLNQGTNVTLQANNDITVSNDVIVDNTSGAGGGFTLQAGRNININANIDTDDGWFQVIVGDQPTISESTIVSSDTDEGTPTITIAEGKTINAGEGLIALLASNGKFVNNSGSATPFTAAATWIFLPSYENAILNGMNIDAKKYNTTIENFSFGSLGVNMYYSIAPVLTVTTSSNQTSTYGDSFTVGAYTLSGFVDGDILSTSGISGTATYTIGGSKSSSGNYIVGAHDISYSSGLLSNLGYSFADDSTVSNELTITAKPTNEVNNIITAITNTNVLKVEIPKVFKTPIVGQKVAENNQTTNGTPNQEDVRVPLSRNSVVELVNGGLNLPDGVDQLFFVASNENQEN